MTYNTEILRIGKIQYRQNGVIMGLVSQTDAIEMVDSGIYRIINSHAIEWVGITPDDTD